MADASFTYPANGNFSTESPTGNINIYDTLEVTYKSVWDKLNLTFFCLSSTTATDYKVFGVKENPIASSGTYRFDQIIDVGFDISQYPTKCHFKLTQYGNNDNALDGKVWNLVSEVGVSTTYRSTSMLTTSTYTTQTTTSGDISPPATSATSSATSSKSTFTSTRTKPLTSSAADSQISVSSSASVASQSASVGTTPSSGLSGLAIGGIGAGTGSAVIIIAVLSFIIFRLRRKAQLRARGSRLSNSSKLEMPAFSHNWHSKNKFSSVTSEIGGTSRSELATFTSNKKPSELA